MNLLAALLVVVRYTLHNVKTFILVIYCVVLRISFANCIFINKFYFGLNGFSPSTIHNSGINIGASITINIQTIANFIR